MKTYMLDHSHKPEDCGRALEELEKHKSPLKGKKYWCGCEGETHHGYFLVKAKTKKDALKQLPSWVRTSATAVSVDSMDYP